MIVAWGLLFVLAAGLAGLGAWQRAETQALRRTWQSLLHAGQDPRTGFDPASVDALPDAARRFFRFSIGPGTPLRSVAEVCMRGEIGLGSKTTPNYLPMRAREILAPPHGFIWEVAAGQGLMRLSGSDGATTESSWSRFRMLGILPVVRAGGSEDHRRAAFGRLVGEAVFWVPAALLPGTGIRWTGVDADTARVTVDFAGLSQSVDISVAADGRVVSVVLPRWSDANPDKTFRLQPFGGTLSDFATFDGYRVPTRVEAGNFFGSEDYFAFFRAVVDDIRYRQPSKAE